MRIKTATIFAAAMAAATLTTAHAMTNDRDWPSVVVRPAIDVPMQDTAITRAPDGTYYLIGTVGKEVSGFSVQVSGKGVTETSGLKPEPERSGDGRSQTRSLTPSHDFDNCRQVKLWKSRDLKQWDEVGVVFDLENPAGDYAKHNWMTRQAHKDTSSADSPVCWGIKAPELHRVGKDWYICFSMNNQGTGLIKSTTGKPEGPYAAHGQITLRHGDASMFWDEKDEFGGDNAVYWLFGGGWIAKMNDDLTALAEKPRLLQPTPQTQIENMGKRLDHPLQVGDRGVFLFKTRGRYYLTAAERTNRLNASCDDTFVASAESVYGPYGQRMLMVPHGGGLTVFPGPASSAVPKYHYPQQHHFLNSVSQYAKPKAEVEKGKDGPTFYATFSGNDVRAIYRDRPGFLPLEWTGPERCEFLFYDVESKPRKPLNVFTERGPWPWMKPLLPGERHRDIKVAPAPDGHYYFSGSSYNHPGKLMVWKLKDLITWEMIGPVWTYEQIDWLPEKKPMPPKAYPFDPEGLQPAWQHVFWHTFVTWWKDTFYITFCIFDNDNPPGRGVTALKSTTGKIEGPYVSLGRVGGQLGKDPGPVFDDYMFYHDGTLYASDWQNWRDYVAVADLNKPGWKWDWKKVDQGIYDIMQRGDGCSVDSIEGVPILCFRSSGPQSGGQTGLFTYDVNYVPMESVWGPVVKDAKPRNIPHVAMSNLFKDHQGRWWSSLFGSSEPPVPWAEKFGLVPLRVEKRGDHDVCIDVEDNPSDELKRIIGGGTIAEVKTVQETLK